MLGLIGGTGLYRLEGLADPRRVTIDTPFGPTSSPLTLGRFENLPTAFLARHGEGHELLPSEINYRANIWALKSVGATELVSVSAVGSLDRSLLPGSLVLPSQYLDFTKGNRNATYFGDGLTAHVAVDQPTCRRLRERLHDAARSKNLDVTDDKAYACVEGPRLETCAEARMLRTLGGDVVGMTNVPEAFLAREAQLCYASICIVTNYVAGIADGAATDVEVILAEYARSIGKVRELLATLSSSATDDANCLCRNSLRSAVLTPDKRLTDRHRALLQVLRS